MKHLLPALVSGLWLLVSPAAHALIDVGNNSLSDIWERNFNGGALFSASNPAHAPSADPIMTISIT